MNLLDYLNISIEDLMFYHFLAAAVLFVVVLSAERKISSYTVSVAIIMIHELAAIAVNPQILAFAYKPGVFNVFSWYALWASFNLVTVCLIYFSHLKLKLRATNACLFYCGLLLFLSLLQLLQYINTITLKISLVIDFYSFAIFISNIVYVPIFILLWAIEKMKHSKNMTMIQAQL